MDKHRIAGAAKKAKGEVKAGLGKLLGDSKLRNEGRADKVAGTVENAVGGVADTARDAQRKARPQTAHRH